MKSSRRSSKAPPPPEPHPITRWIRKRTVREATVVVISMLAIVGAVWLWVPKPTWNLSALRDLIFLSSGWFYALAVLPLFVWAHLRGLLDFGRTQRTVALLVRMLLAVSLITALARPSMRERSEAMSVVALVDVSDSMPAEALRKAHAFLQAADAERGDNDLTVLTFAGDTRRVELDKEAQAFKRHSAATAQSGQESAGEPHQASATRLGHALDIAQAMLDPAKVPHIVLFTDGISQDQRRQPPKSPVSFVPPDWEEPAEVGIRALDVPQSIRVGEPFEVSATLFSTRKASVELQLFSGKAPNKREPSKKVDLEPGETVVRFESSVEVPGAVRYRAKLVTEAPDTHSENNTFETATTVPGRPQVLIAGDATGRTPIDTALRRAGYDVDWRSGKGLPQAAGELSKFDFVILSDVPASHVTPGQQDALVRYIRGGGGFLMAGGSQGFGLGGWRGSILEKALPVRMDSQKRREEASLALALVIDKSGSMNGIKIQLAKEAAIRTAELLGPADLIDVVAFDNRPERLVRLERAKNRHRIVRSIGRLHASGGTRIFPALDNAYQDLISARAKVKHTILLTDGQSDETGIAELVQIMRAEGITVSAVGLGADVDRPLLQSIANLGGGRAHFTNDPHRIPRIFMKETETVARSSAVEDYFSPIVRQLADFLRGVPMNTAPWLKGYVATEAKPPPAQVILQSEIGEPVLARWRHGLGWSLAWTSDLKPRWASEWLRWSGFSTFISQLIREHMRQDRTNEFPMQVRVEGEEAVARVDALDTNDAFINGLDARLEITPPESRDERAEPEEDSVVSPQNLSKHSREEPWTQRMRQVAPGRYEARIPLEQFGTYSLEATHSLDDRKVASSHGQVANPFPREFLDLKPRTSELKALAANTGGSELRDPKALFDAQGRHTETQRELWPKLIMLAIALFLLDILLRRVRFGSYRS